MPVVTSSEKGLLDVCVVLVVVEGLVNPYVPLGAWSVPYGLVPIQLLRLGGHA